MKIAALWIALVCLATSSIAAERTYHVQVPWFSGPGQKPAVSCENGQLVTGVRAKQFDSEQEGLGEILCNFLN